jgi:hypothetical protein
MASIFECFVSIVVESSVVWNIEMSKSTQTNPRIIPFFKGMMRGTPLETL